MGEFPVFIKDFVQPLCQVLVPKLNFIYGKWEEKSVLNLQHWLKIADVNNLKLHHSLNCLHLLNTRPVSISLSKVCFPLCSSAVTVFASTAPPLSPSGPTRAQATGGAGGADVNPLHRGCASAPLGETGGPGRPRPGMLIGLIWAVVLP